MLVLSAFLGGALGSLAVVIVVTVYRFKETSQAGLARTIGVSIAATFAVLALYILRHVIGDGAKLELPPAISFGLGVLVSMCIGFYFARDKIG